MKMFPEMQRGEKGLPTVIKINESSKIAAEKQATITAKQIWGEFAPAVLDCTLDVNNLVVVRLYQNL